MSNVFITSASGNIGTELVPLLIKSDAIKTLLLPTSNAARLKDSIPSSNKTTVVEGSIQDPQWLETQFANNKIDTVFLNLTGTDELFTTMNFLSSIQRSGTVKHLVYLSACGNFLSPDFANTVLRQCLAAHVLVKVITEQTLQATRPPSDPRGFSWTIIGPTLFMENDRRAKGPMMASGFFPEPIGTGGVSRVACRDIALGVAKAIEDQGRVWDRKKVMIGTKRTYTVLAFLFRLLWRSIRMGTEGLTSGNRQMTWLNCGVLRWGKQSQCSRATRTAWTVWRSCLQREKDRLGAGTCAW